MFTSRNGKVHESINELLFNALTAEFLSRESFIESYSQKQCLDLSDESNLRSRFEDSEFIVIFDFNKSEGSNAIPNHVIVYQKYKSWKSGRTVKDKIMDFIPFSTFDTYELKWNQIDSRANNIANQIVRSLQKINYRIIEKCN